ncbi:saccharopine dehydrogenase [Candidatus Pantoea multigeneris]|uniref:Saccharopine dehydrogenase n=1 Tax=Candidatus Pantoea multigeneris TaxID=2608357 RepID=A0ABX0R8E3_9GAMM|nr:saccharopine dehydrogenase [Pantoea multigeneris]NIF21638.1 saccharopine dehydrogenase [Pantoea multigeneris]
MIGILGGFGAVGGEVARMLHLWGETSLRVGGRHPQPLPWAQSCYVDVSDEKSLMAFASGCRLIVNCAAPSARLSLPVANRLRAAGIPLVDAGGIDCPVQFTHQTGMPPVSALFGAGALPGLSGILPAWLAAKLDRVDALHAWFGVFDRFTRSGAEDYLDGVLRAPAPLSALPRRQSNVTLPFFPHPVQLQPYEDEESRHVTHRLGLRTSRWQLALAGEHLARALDSARELPREAAIRAVVEGSELDVAGRQPWVNFLIQVEGRRQGNLTTLTLLLKAPGIAQLTAACAATCAKWLFNSPYPVVGLAAHHVDVSAFMQLFCHGQTGISMELFDNSVEQLSEMCGGAL